MTQLSKTALLTDIASNVYTNLQRLIKGNTVKDRMVNIVDSTLNKTDDPNVSYVPVVSGLADITTIKKSSPTGQYLKDDGTWSSVKFGPFASVALAKSGVPLGSRYDGLTVMITGVGEYWWQAVDLTDTGLAIKPTGTTQETVRYVYLVADAADQAAIGGISKNVYITAQSAWDAAVTIATANSLYQVIIVVGSITAALAGTLTTTLDATSTRITWIGQYNGSSIIGNITYTNSTNNTVKMINMTCGTVSFSQTALVNTTITCQNTTWGNTTFSQTGTALTTPSTILFNQCLSLRTGTITISGTTPTTNSGNLSFTACSDCSFGTLTFPNYNLTVGSASESSINNFSALSNSTSVLNVTITMFNAVINTIGTIGGVGTQTRTYTFYNCLISQLSPTLSTGTNLLMFVNCTFNNTITMTSYSGTTSRFVFRSCSIQQITNMGPNCIFQTCSFYQPQTASSAIILVTNNVTGCEFWGCTLLAFGGSTINSLGGAVTGMSVKFTSSGSYANLPASAGYTLT